MRTPAQRRYGVRGRNTPHHPSARPDPHLKQPVEGEGGGSASSSSDAGARRAQPVGAASVTPPNRIAANSRPAIAGAEIGSRRRRHRW